MLRRSTSLISFFFNVPPTAEIYTLSLHDALPILRRALDRDHPLEGAFDGQRQGDAATPGPDVGHRTPRFPFPVSRFPHCPQHQLYQSLGLRSRNQRPWVNLQVERAETRAAHGVRERDAARALLHRVPELLQEL